MNIIQNYHNSQSYSIKIQYDHLCGHHTLGFALQLVIITPTVSNIANAPISAVRTAVADCHINNQSINHAHSFLHACSVLLAIQLLMLYSSAAAGRSFIQLATQSQVAIAFYYYIVHSYVWSGTSCMFVHVTCLVRLVTLSQL